MKTNSLHIIAFDIPFPADYGGVMDVFYKIKALKAEGFDIILHCFQYRERAPQAELERHCQKVYYYKRQMTPLSILGKKPYIVASRQSLELLKNLIKDDFPIIFEGLHTCAFINNAALKNRFKIVRMHNVEWEYYQNLKSLETSYFKKIYFKTESYKLKKYEINVLKNANCVLTISPDDQFYFENLIEKLNVPNCALAYIPPFHPNSEVESKTGTGKYVLFHGKLSVSDNEQAALYLIKKIFSTKQMPLIIAGKDPSTLLIEAAKPYDFIKIIANPNENEMNDLIQNAQINVLLSFQRSGMKLKLLNALYRGRFCVANQQMIQNTGLESLCYVKNTSKEIAATIESLMNLQFSQKQITDRKDILEKSFSNVQNANKIAKILRG